MWNTCYCCYDFYYSFFYYSCCYCHHRYYYKYVCIFLDVLFLFAINSTKDYQKILLQKVKFFTFIAIKQHCLDIVLLLLLFIVAELCPTLWDSMDCSLPASSVHGIFQAKILEWGSISFSRRSSWPKDRIWVFCLAGEFFTIEPLSP